MNIPTRDMADFSDDDIVEIARAVESHDFDRIAPPPQVWNNILADLEVEVATQEASARRHSPQPILLDPHSVDRSCDPLDGGGRGCDC